MKLHILGSNGPFPSAGGACSGYLVESGDTLLQLDLGCGTLGALTALCDPCSVTALLFSHWHHDHSSDVLPLMYRLQSAGARLKVYGPESPDSPEFRAVRDDDVFDLTTVRPGDTLTIGGASVEVLQARHPVPAVMYRIGAEGRVLSFTGDTNTTADLPRLCENADLLLADGLFPESAWSEAKPHLSGVLAARYALEGHAKQLVITHFNPMIDRAGLMKEIRTVRPDAQEARPGQVFEV